MLTNRYTKETDNRIFRFFVACGYKRGKVLNEMRRVLTLTQEQCLQTKERQPMDRIPLLTTYNPHATFIAEVAKRNWNFLQSKERLALTFHNPPLVAYRRPKSLRDRLVSTKFRNGTADNALIPRGCMLIPLVLKGADAASVS